MRIQKVILAGVCALLGSAVGFGAEVSSYNGPGLRPARLRCEYLVNPLGIGETKPRLSWIVESGERGQRQTAYRVLVAADEAALQKNAGDLWDSGKVDSDETICIEYAGKPLKSAQRCFWKVMVWDKDGKPSDWSGAASWGMGLLDPSDWQAKWIGFDAPRSEKLPDAPFEGAKWIWFAGDPQPSPPKCKRVFFAKVALPDPAEIESAQLLVTGDDVYSINVNGNRVAVSEPGNDGWRRAGLIDVLRNLKAGDNEVRAAVDNLVDSPAGFLAKLTVKTKAGKQIVLATDASWLATDKPTANPANAKAWSACRVLGDYGMQPWGKIQQAGVITPPAAYLRTDFRAAKPVARATLFATALGWFDAHLNGKRVTNDRFIPGWTDYHKRVYYRAYDVTPMIRAGDNAFGAVLSDGWFSGYIGWYGKREHYGSKPRFLGQIVLEYADGSREVIASNPEWRAATGPITGADILMGESYDARREMPGWDSPGVNASAWKPVDTGREVSPIVEPHPAQPVVPVAEFHAKSVAEPSPGVYVLNMGQNFAGIARLKVHGKPGQKITLRFAERLNPDGTIYTLNLRGARATDSYICRGGDETWEPRFTFHGFQYVEITGLTEKPAPDAVTGIALSSATPPAGRFECSDPMVNQLVSNIRWTQLMNFIDVPTDCPQRDERMGWTGDAQIYVRTATLNTDVQRFFTKWLVDLDDAQRADGQYPKVAPLMPNLDDGGPAWQDAGVICPWTIYEVYGDRRLLERHYPNMKRFIEFCKSRSTPDMLPPEKFHCFGDWLSIKADTPKDVICTAYFAYSVQLMAYAAEELGNKEDAAKYKALFEKIKASFNKAYVDAEGRIKGDTQAVYVMAIAFGLLDDKKKSKVAIDRLVADIEKRGNHLSTGFIGTKDLMLALALERRNDVAYRLLHNDTFPSWGFSIRHGATSIWERWDGWTPDKGFQTPGMNSFAHYSFGAVYQWMIEYVGGIDQISTAYKKILIHPTPGGKLTWAKAEYDSVRGRIATEWRRDGEKQFLNVTIPANTTAVVMLPAGEGAKITESGKPLEQAKTWINVIGPTATELGLLVQSGRYEFTIEPGKGR